MTQRMSVDEAQKQLLSIVRSIAAGGEAVELEDRRRVVATIVGAELEPDENEPVPNEAAHPLSALPELFGNPTDEEVDEFLRNVYQKRVLDHGRAVEFAD